MKKLLLLLVLFLSTSYYSNAQVIDIVGKGINGISSATIELNDLDNIKQVDAVAISKGLWVKPDSEGVQFDNKDKPSSSWSTVDEYNSPSYDESVGYYSRTFNNPIDKQINATIKELTKNYVHSFITYIYRDITDAAYTSFINSKSAFIYHNGSVDPVVYEIPINTAPTTRNILVKIPITELDFRERMMVIKIDAGLSEPEIFIETTWDVESGNSFLLGKYTLENVPGDVTNVTVSVYSPDPDIDKKDGDSFFISGVVVDVDIVYNGCTFTQGYWKTHSDCKTNGNGKGNGPEPDETWKLIGPDRNRDIGEISIFMEYKDVKDEQTYCQVFDTNSGKGGKYYILAHQYIAAELNILNGASPYPSAFDKAKLFLESNTPSDVKGNKSLEARCVELGGILADFNEGAIGPGHCDDDETASKILDVEELESLDNKVKIYPNPATSIGRINFTPQENAETTVEVYNVLGQKISVLYDEYTMGGVPVSVDYDAQRFKQGIHFVHIKNGSSSVTKKLSISK